MYVCMYACMYEVFFWLTSFWVFVFPPSPSSSSSSSNNFFFFFFFFFDLFLLGSCFFARPPQKRKQKTENRQTDRQTQIHRENIRSTPHSLTRSCNQSSTTERIHHHREEIADKQGREKKDIKLHNTTQHNTEKRKQWKGGDNFIIITIIILVVVVVCRHCHYHRGCSPSLTISSFTGKRQSLPIKLSSSSPFSLPRNVPCVNPFPTINQFLGTSLLSIRFFLYFLFRLTLIQAYHSVCRLTQSFLHFLFFWSFSSDSLTLR